MTGRPNWPELLTALAFALVGLGAAIIAFVDYPLGTIVRMGPGYVPIVLGGLLAVKGAWLAWQGLGAPAETERPALRAAVLILGGILLWALLVDRAGFVPATVALAVCCGLAEPENGPLSIAGLALGLCLMGYLIFIRGLGIPIQPFGG